ncbi:MAG TPA: aldehyde dehydrogenase family protein, partial [Opitutaceae bacterium]|nr:aldehyde dehydrogenase family protein [Opitutaceae bacterium]
MRIPQQLFVDGKDCDGAAGKRMTLTNPATEEPFVEIACAEVSDVDRAVESAHHVFMKQWRDLAPGNRARILFDIAARIRQNAETIARLECQEIGKPIRDGRDEAELGARIFEYYAGAVGKFYGQTIPVARGGFDFTVREPLGVIAAIVPWNFPFPIACWKVAPALAAGNTVILKPASLSPLTALLLGQIAAESGLPSGALQVLSGSGTDLGEALTRHPRVRKISFTGSTSVGARIMAGAAPEIKRVSLELGGKSPNIV